MRRFLYLLLLATSAAANPAGAETLLHAAGTATVMVAPDEIAAALQAEALHPTAAAAQDRVNELMRDALAAAQAVPGVTVSTGGYGVWRVAAAEGRPERWQASQMLNLSGRGGPDMLALVGKLQEAGLAVGNLGWRLSRAAERKAQQEATERALFDLRGRIDAAAAVLGLRFEQFKELRLDGNRSPIMPRAFSAGAPGSGPGAPAIVPSAVPEDLAVSATVEGDAVLQPR